MSDKLKAGIVGCGAIATIRHIPAFLKIKGRVSIGAVCDVNEKLARETAAKNGIPGAYTDLAKLLAAEKPDIIDICTPPQVHASLAVKALEAGCHVILEKPMALKTEDCDAMIAAAEKSGRKLCVIHNQLFYPPVIKARELVAAGAIGDFIGMRVLISDPRDEMVMRENYWVHRLPGGLIGETGPHAVYRSLAFIGKVKNVDVYARSFLEHPWAPFDEFRIELEGEKASSSIVVSYPSRRREVSMDLWGMEGALHLDLLSMLLTHQGRNKSMKPATLAFSSLRNAAQIISGVGGNAFGLLTGREFYGHNTIIGAFVDSVLTGGEPPITAAEGRETTRALEMVIARLHEKYGV
jgi:predicted dehydrogenase